MELPEESYFRPCHYSIGSVHQQIVHTLGAEWLWLQRLRGETPDPFIHSDVCPTRQDARRRWDTIESAWRVFAADLTDEQLDRPLVYLSIKGNQRRQQVFWECMEQIINHSTDHRAQTLALIHQLGGRTIEQDFVLYTWEHPSE